MICGAARCSVTNKKYLRAADTKFCIRDSIVDMSDRQSINRCSLLIGRWRHQLFIRDQWHSDLIKSTLHECKRLTKHTQGLPWVRHHKGHIRIGDKKRAGCCGEITFVFPAFPLFSLAPQVLAFVHLEETQKNTQDFDPPQYLLTNLLPRQVTMDGRRWKTSQVEGLPQEVFVRNIGQGTASLKQK